MRGRCSLQQQRKIEDLKNCYCFLNTSTSIIIMIHMLKRQEGTIKRDEASRKNFKEKNFIALKSCI
jgi:hypothetical protein